MSHTNELITAVNQLQRTIREMGLDPVRIQLADVLDAKALRAFLEHDCGSTVAIPPGHPDRLPPNQIKIGDTIFFYRPDPHL